jgi:hypothetical protein
MQDEKFQCSKQNKSHNTGVLHTYGLLYSVAAFAFILLYCNTAQFQKARIVIHIFLWGLPTDPLSAGPANSLSAQRKKSVFRSNAWTVAPPGGQQVTSCSIALAVIRSRLVKLVSCEVLKQKLRKNAWMICKRMFSCS